MTLLRSPSVQFLLVVERGRMGLALVEEACASIKIASHLLLRWVLHWSDRRHISHSFDFSVRCGQHRRSIIVLQFIHRGRSIRRGRGSVVQVIQLQLLLLHGLTDVGRLLNPTLSSLLVPLGDMLPKLGMIDLGGI